MLILHSFTTPFFHINSVKFFLYRSMPIKSISSLLFSILSRTLFANYICSYLSLTARTPIFRRTSLYPLLYILPLFVLFSVCVTAFVSIISVVNSLVVFLFLFILFSCAYLSFLLLVVVSTIFSYSPITLTLLPYVRPFLYP